MDYAIGVDPASANGDYTAVVLIDRSYRASRLMLNLLADGMDIFALTTEQSVDELERVVFVLAAYDTAYLARFSPKVRHNILRRRSRRREG